MQRLSNPRIPVRGKTIKFLTDFKGLDNVLVHVEYMAFILQTNKTLIAVLLCCNQLLKQSIGRLSNPAQAAPTYFRCNINT